MSTPCYTADLMADVRPFRGLRFTASAVPDLGLVLCPPYDVIDAEDLLRGGQHLAGWVATRIRQTGSRGWSRRRRQR